MQRSYHHWTEDDREIVRRDYDGTVASLERIALKLGRGATAEGVRRQTQYLGIATNGNRGRGYGNRRYWTQEEIDQLQELTGRLHPRLIADRLKRSVTAVVVQMKRQGLSRAARDGWYTKAEVCAILGEDHKWVQRRMDSGELKATVVGDQQPGQRGGAMWRIEAKDLREFIRHNAFALNGRNVDLVQVVELLAGIAL